MTSPALLHAIVLNAYPTRLYILATNPGIVAGIDKSHIITVLLNVYCHRAPMQPLIIMLARTPHKVIEELYKETTSGSHEQLNPIT